MDDKGIDRYITNQIKKRGITLYDIIGGEYIDPAPDNNDLPPGQRARWNRFSSTSWDLRLCELLTEKGFDPENPYKKLAIPVKDLVRFWGNNCVERDAVLEGIFEDILAFYKDRMLPEEKPKKKPDLSGAVEGFKEAI